MGDRVCVDASARSGPIAAWAQTSLRSSDYTLTNHANRLIFEVYRGELLSAIFSKVSTSMDCV
jgi:hypothetical protein